MPDQRLARQPRRRAAYDQRLLRIGIDDVVTACELGELPGQRGDAGDGPQSLAPAAAAPDTQDGAAGFDHRGRDGMGAQEIREGPFCMSATCKGDCQCIAVSNNDSSAPPTSEA